MHSGSTLADLVTAAPATTRVLERHHLDYCCGGGQSPRTACTAAGVDPDSVLAEIEALGAVPPADACASYRALYAACEEPEADTHLHVHKENNVLFPAVLGPGNGQATP